MLKSLFMILKVLRFLLNCKSMLMGLFYILTLMSFYMLKLFNILKLLKIFEVVLYVGAVLHVEVV